MRKTVLFSPVGGHDPIANYHDGAMLHICRCYRPSAVYLYLSQEMVQRSRLDNRYEAALRKLGNSLGYEIEEIKIIERENLTDVQLFDAFYEEFETILDQIKSQYPEAEILVNTSSGTPAMKSALNLISALTKHKITSVQVSTPNKKENPKNEDPLQFDLDSFWECNEDNRPDFEKRCDVFDQVNLLTKIKKEMIVQLIEAYDYHAALLIAEGIGEFISPDVTALLRAAESRLMLNQSGIDTALQGTGYQILPIRTNGRKKEIFEYLLYLQLRQKQGHYADFIRGITPVILDLLEECLEVNCNIDMKEFCVERIKYNGDREYRLSNKKLEQSEKGRYVQEILKKRFQNEVKEQFYSSAQIYPILGELMQKDTDLCEILKRLDRVESEVRNVTAHQIVSVTDEWIQKKVSLSSGDIMKLLKQLAVKAKLPVKNEYWDSYDHMNRQIIELLCL